MAGSRGSAPNLKPPASERTVWHIDQQGEQAGIHPTQKPVELFLKFHNRPGDIVYEPFCGSGTQLIAAERTGRVCYAMEQEPRVRPGRGPPLGELPGQKAVREPAP